ncbi:RHS repeat-associated core domain-containing protein (plasmid) [Klebsiella pneumoniae]|nr:RHS repeat-associated core domain-containing protein [Klebsiella pneumoniae]
MLTDGPQGITRYIYLGKELIAKTGSSAALEDKPGYTGHLEDRDIGLTYMQQRYYDSVIGRFYSNDPVGFSADKPMMFNRYAYANNNPYKYTDPDGQESYLVSRPLSFTSSANHNFIVHNATSLGDPES